MGNEAVEQKRLQAYLSSFEKRIFKVENENKTLKREIHTLKATVFQDIKPYKEATYNAVRLEKMWNLRLRILQLISQLHNKNQKPVSEQDVYQAFKKQFPDVLIGNPASIGARMRELAFAPDYKRWYGQLLLRASTGRYFPNSNPPLKLLISDCRREEPCESCESLPGCVRRALKGKRGK